MRVGLDSKGMFIETKEIGSEGLAIDRFVDEPAPLALAGDEVARVGRTHLVGELYREAGCIAFVGDIQSAVTLACGRCLESYALPMELHFNLLYTTAPEEAGRKESRLDEDSITLTNFDGVRIDLAALLTEQIYLGLPLKPLCRTDCRGLCARCGVNLNEGSCACEAGASVDPRLRSLKTLF